MDHNTALLTIIAEQRILISSKDGHIEYLVKINNDLASNLRETQEALRKALECQQTSPSQ